MRARTVYLELVPTQALAYLAVGVVAAQKASVNSTILMLSSITAVCCQAAVRLATWQAAASQLLGRASPLASRALCSAGLSLQQRPQVLESAMQLWRGPAAWPAGLLVYVITHLPDIDLPVRSVQPAATPATAAFDLGRSR